MRYEGPKYRPPSEADSLLIQATIGCPHNRCTFCIGYKSGPRFRVRDVADIKEDLLAATEYYGTNVRTLFFPAGNTIAMKTVDFCEVLLFSKKVSQSWSALPSMALPSISTKKALKKDNQSFRPFYIGTE